MVSIILEALNGAALPAQVIRKGSLARRSCSAKLYVTVVFVDYPLARSYFSDVALK